MLGEGYGWIEGEFREFRNKNRQIQSSDGEDIGFIWNQGVDLNLWKR